jgi:hypothetical protein
MTTTLLQSRQRKACYNKNKRVKGTHQEPLHHGVKHASAYAAFSMEPYLDDKLIPHLPTEPFGAVQTDPSNT